MSDLWSQIRAELFNAAHEDTHETYFSGLTVVSENDERLVLGSHDEMAALVMTRTYKRYMERVATALRGGAVVHVDVVYLDAAPAPAKPAPTAQLSLFPSAPAPVRQAERPPVAAFQVAQPSVATSLERGSQVRVSWQDRIHECGLNPRLDLENFVVGSSNEFAYQAASAVIETPGVLYNPLLIYGGVGLGKTHLMNAVGLALLKRNPRLRVRYLSAETFVNELIQALNTKTMDRFRQRNRIDADVLLVDDVQFFAGKERTQEEFFHTFNALQQAGRQIILTSDRAPKDVPHLTERLVSRLSMGLIVDVQPPDLETRIAILERKAASLGFGISREVVVTIAEHVRSNVRELHGALMRIGSYARHHQVEVTPELARAQLVKVANEAQTTTTKEKILDMVCAHFGVRRAEVLGRRRVATIAEPRKVAMYLAKQWTTASYPELGRFFGRDHTTVLHAYRAIEKDLASGHPIRAHIEDIERKLQVR